MSDNSYTKHGAGSPRLLKTLIAGSVLSAQIAHGITLSSHSIQDFNHRSLYAIASDKGMTITRNPILPNEYLAFVSGPSLMDETKESLSGRATLGQELTAVDHLLVPSAENDLELPKILSNELHTPSVIWVGDSTDLPLLDGELRFLNPIFASFHQIAHASISKAGDHSIAQFEKESPIAPLLWREIQADTFAALATAKSAELSKHDTLKLIDNIIQNRTEMMFLSLAPAKYANFTALGLEVVRDWISKDTIRPMDLELSSLAHLTENMTTQLLQVDQHMTARRNIIEKDPGEAAQRLQSLADHIARRDTSPLDLTGFQNWLGDPMSYPGARTEMFKILSPNFITSMTDEQRSHYYENLAPELAKTPGMIGYTGTYPLYSHSVLSGIEQHMERETSAYRLMKTQTIETIRKDMGVDWIRNAASNGTYNRQRNLTEKHHDPFTQ